MTVQLFLYDSVGIVCGVAGGVCVLAVLRIPVVSALLAVYPQITCGVYWCAMTWLLGYISGMCAIIKGWHTPRKRVEAQDLNRQDPHLLREEYQSMAVFDKTEILKQYRFLPGRAYLQYDQAFVVFHKKPLQTP